ncbi:hypothetical protein N8I77_002601 [Diaporthe amygdali]|uniref:Uncharacterized protein n=1 Tax=Phomopsis amygdali TaxID=1214568 RepID=A0AAD9SUH7_PHOAM|nr:hypothetical protein N8I77_002601 [Diaporthe amygdali]
MSADEKQNSSISDAVLHWVNATQDNTPGAESLAKNTSRARPKFKVRRKFFEAIQNGDEAGVEESLQDGADPNDVAPSTWLSDVYSPRTALHLAIEQGHIDIVSLLLGNGANPDFVNESEDKTALHVAADEREPRIVELLLRFNADVNRTDGEDETPLDTILGQARYRENDKNLIRIASLLVAQDGTRLNFPSKSNSSTVLHRACSIGLVDIVQQMLTKGASFDARDETDRLPIHFASKNGKVETVLELLKAGASPNVYDAKGKTPLHLAVAQSHLAVARELIASGALVDIKDAKGRTPIFKAARNGDIELVKMVVDSRQYADSRALIRVRDAVTGRTPLHLASANNHGEAVSTLLALGADIDSAAFDGSRPLHDAILYRAMNSVDQLLESGAKYDVASSGTHSVQVLEPAWEDLLRLLFLGHHVRPGDLVLSPPASGSEDEAVNEGLRAAIWPWNPAPFMLATPTVHELLYSAPRLLQKRSNSAKASWVHLPANNDIFKVLYAQNDTYRDENQNTANIFGIRERRKLSSILAFINDEFAGKNEGRGIRRTRVMERSGGRKWYTEKIDKDQMFAVAIPVIDIDIRRPYYDRSKTRRPSESSGVEQSQKRNMKMQGVDHDKRHSVYDRNAQLLKRVKEYTAEDEDDLTTEELSYRSLLSKLNQSCGSHGRIDLPVSLDQYFHESMDEVDINLRNGDQVISRFIARQKAVWEDTKEHESKNQSTQAESSKTIASPSVGVRTPSGLEAGLGETGQPLDSNIEVASRFRQRILTVPKFWVWKLDETTIVTSFPQRWDHTSAENALTKAIWSRLTETILNAEQTPGKSIALDADQILDTIIQTCLGFQPSFILENQEYKYPDVFAAEIAFVSREVSHFYSTYEASLGKGIEDFSRSIKLTTECLITIEDILNEMAMIRRVLRDQGRVLLSLQQTQNIGDDKDSLGDYSTAEWGFEGMRSSEMKHVIARLKHLEKDATMVRKSIVTLLDLRQRQVAIEMAMSSETQSDILFKQSSILFIFTAATVLFTPLAWVSSFMALDVNHFTPEKWGQSQVVGAHIGSALVTWILCALGLFAYLRYQNHSIKAKEEQQI